VSVPNMAALNVELIKLLVILSGVPEKFKQCIVDRVLLVAA